MSLQPKLPAGVVLPSDAEAARAAIAEAEELARQEQAGLALLEKIESEKIALDLVMI